MNDERLRDAYERGLPASDGSPSLDEVTAERLRRLVEREGNESERLRTLDLFLATAEGRRELDIALAAVKAARPPLVDWRRYALAASVLIIAGAATLWWRERDADVTPTLRGAESPVTLLAPLGGVPQNAARRFAWRPVGGAERYTLVVVDTTGSELYAKETRDTVSILPDSVQLMPGRPYLWWIQARLSDQSTVTAAPQRVFVSSR